MKYPCSTTVIRIFQITAYLALVLTLTACGGEKDGNGGSPPLPPQTDPTPNQPSASNVSTFDGETQTVSLRTPTGQTISTPDQVYVASPAPVLHTPQYSAREWIGYSDSHLLTGYIHATWNTEDHADFLTLGAWADQSALNFASPLAPVTIGALFDAPEFRHSTAIPPSASRATYRGTATGAYKNIATPGTDHALFAAPVELNADFQQDSISGCIGCSGAGIVGLPAGIPDVMSLARLNSTTIHMDRAIITNANSTWTGAGINVVTARNSPFSIREASGSWQGAFSSRNDDLGNPRAAGGTAEGQITYDNATTLSFSAAFIGGTE